MTNPELDAAVATQVMGDSLQKGSLKDAEYLVWDQSFWRPFRPATDARDTERVMLRLGQLGLDLRLCVHATAGMGQRGTAAYLKELDSTAPDFEDHDWKRAVCLAAVEACNETADATSA